VNFIVGGTIRRLQQKSNGDKPAKYSFVVHTEMSKASHNWQEFIVTKLLESLIHEATTESLTINKLIKESYKNLENSLKLSGAYYPNLDIVAKTTLKSLVEGHVMVTRVNSDNDVKLLLDRKGQLKLRTPLNIFIGGQILDRGLTISRLIGFYYGRNPKKFQQDTVLQHSRMYGARTQGDLSVTRFYTTEYIFEMMRKINEFDEALREAFLKGAHENGVYFLRKDDLNRLVPCSPNKLMLSKITTLRPYKRLLPVGFQTQYKSYIKKATEIIDKYIITIEENINETNGGYLIDLDLAKKLIQISNSVLNYHDYITKWWRANNLVLMK